MCEIFNMLSQLSLYRMHNDEEERRGIIFPDCGDSGLGWVLMPK
jgi:hypothetical protein